MAERYRNKEKSLYCIKNQENNIVIDPVIQNLFRVLNLILSNVKGKTKKYAGVCINFLYIL